METSFYKPEQDEIVIFFLNELKKNISENLKNVILYGSRARGDFFKHSDYDFLIILKKKNLQIKELIYDIGYEVLDVFEKLASCIIWDEEEWETKKDFSLGKNIQNDGIVLL